MSVQAITPARSTNVPTLSPVAKARDSAAAHGKRRRRNPFTIFEAMEAQHLAESVLHRALWFTADSIGRTGDAAEIAFLLSEIFPDLSNPDWVTKRKIFIKKIIT